MSERLQQVYERAQVELTGDTHGWIHTWLAAVGAAAGIVLSVAPWNFFPLAFFALIPMLVVTQHTTDGQVFRRAWLFGILTNLGGFPWVVGLVVKFGGMPPIVGFVLLLLLAMQQGLVPALGFWFARKIERGFGWRHGMALPFGYVAAEFLMFMIFPWRLGHSQVYHLSFLQLAELGGVHLMTFVLVLVNAGLYDLIRRIRQDGRQAWKEAYVAQAAIGLFLVSELYGAVRIEQVEAHEATLDTITVGLVEGDIEIEDKWDPHKYPTNLYTHQDLSKKAVEEGAELIVWPESAYVSSSYYFVEREGARLKRSAGLPRELYQLPPSDVDLAPTAKADARLGLVPGEREAPQRGFRSALLMGAGPYRRTTDEEKAFLPPQRDGQPRAFLEFNSAILLDKDGYVEGIADKYVMMPISEGIAGAQWLWSNFGINLYAIVPDAGLFGRGDGPTVLTHQRTADNAVQPTARIGILNCYEDLMPSFVRKMGRQQPDFLLNQSNDAWFGRNLEPDQHMALAVPRSVEARTSLVRSTNTGVSAFIGASGRVNARTSVVDPEYLVYDVPLNPSSRTPYRLFGDWIAWLSWGALLTSLVALIRQRPFRKTTTAG